MEILCHNTRERRWSSGFGSPHETSHWGRNGHRGKNRASTRLPRLTAASQSRVLFSSPTLMCAPSSWRTGTQTRPHSLWQTQGLQCDDPNTAAGGPAAGSRGHRGLLLVAAASHESTTRKKSIPAAGGEPAQTLQRAQQTRDSSLPPEGPAGAPCTGTAGL